MSGNVSFLVGSFIVLFADFIGDVGLVVGLVVVVGFVVAVVGVLVVVVVGFGVVIVVVLGVGGLTLVVPVVAFAVVFTDIGFIACDSD